MVKTKLAIEFSHKYTKLAIMPTLASEALHVKTKYSSNKMLPPVSTEPRQIMNLWFQVQQSPFYTNWAFACKTETFGSLYSHALLIVNMSSKLKNQVVHEQKFKNLLSSKYPVSVKRRMFDLESEVH